MKSEQAIVSSMSELRLGKIPLSNPDTHLFHNFVLVLLLSLLACISEEKKQPFPTHFKSVRYHLLNYAQSERNLNLSVAYVLTANLELFCSTACLQCKLILLVLKNKA